jgi:glycosyltransferase involved in cell wall biosynthesis
MGHLIAVNQELADLFRRLGCDAGRISLVPPHAMGSALVARDLANASLPPPLQAFYDLHDPVLVTVGLLEPEYDLELQIDCMETIRTQFPDAGLVIIGSGSLHESLRTRIASTTSAPHILLVGDVPHPTTLQVIAKCRVFLRTTLYDGDSISVREALQLEKPVVATDNGMRPEGVYLIPASHPEALRTTVAEVLTHSPTARTSPPEIGTVNLEAVLRVYEDLTGG